jgi:hypothetical protein
MRRKTTFRPAIDKMEPRIALSSSSNFFSNFFDSIFGNSKNSKSSTAQYTPAQIAHIKAHRQAVHAAHQEKLAEWKAAHGHSH